MVASTSSKESEKMPTLKVSAPLGYGPEGADPAQIQFNDTWGFLENLASPLVQYGADGQLVAGVAESFEWHGDELHLKIRSDYRTIDGLAVTAEDAAFSLKRIIVQARNTHGFIADFLCGDRKLTKVTDECPGISTSGDTLILKPVRGKAFLVRMLTAMDFVVLLQSQVDPNTLAIKSFRNTTGPYYLDGDPAAGTQRYVANPHHWNYSTTMPQEIRLIRYDSSKPKGKDSIVGNICEMFVDGTTDVLTNVSSDRADLYPVAAKMVKDKVTLTPTMDIGRVIAVFTPRGLKELSTARRIALAKTLRAVATDVLVKGDGINTPEEQFFAVYGEGALTSEQLSKLHSKFDAQAAEVDGAGLSIALPSSMGKIEGALKSRLPSAKVSMNMVDYVEGRIPAGQEPHVYIIQTDTGWTEDLGLLAYSVAMKQFFPADQAEGQAWLNHYVEVEDKETRLGLLRDLHLRVLSEPWIVPLVGQPYFTLVRAPWVYKGPTLFASGALWRLHHP